MIFDKKSSKMPVYQFHSKCGCRKNENITVYKQNVIKNSTLYDVVSTLNSFYYTVKEDQLDDLVCGAYETLRRGRHQKVIGYSLYGTNDFYTEYLTSKSLRNLFQANNCFLNSIRYFKSAIALLVKKLYPGWTMRVHHDRSIDKKLKCKLECLKDEKGNLLDNVDYVSLSVSKTKKEIYLITLIFATLKKFRVIKFPIKNSKNGQNNYS